MTVRYLSQYEQKNYVFMGLKKYNTETFQITDNIIAS